MKKFLLICFLLPLYTGYAQENSEVFKLTANHVENFLAEFSAIFTEFEKLGVKYDRDEGGFVLPEAVIEIDKVNAVCKKHGYNDYTDFITQTSAILIAYAVIASDESMAEGSAEI